VAHLNKILSALTVCALMGRWPSTIAAAKMVCLSDLSRIVHVAQARKDVFTVDPEALTRKCLPTTRGLVLSAYPSGNAYAVDAIESLVDAELKFGVEDIQRNQTESAIAFWRAAIQDHQLEFNDPREVGTISIVPNPGLRFIVAKRYKEGFAWFHAQLTAHIAGCWDSSHAPCRIAIPGDVGLVDSGYYNLIAAGWLAGSLGRYADAASSFKKCLEIAPTGSDASLYLGIAELALGNIGFAKSSWATSITERVIGSGIKPQLNAEFGVASAFLWLNQLQHP
jgi:tetratricopeptide (TPR) repeat protein